MATGSTTWKFEPDAVAGQQVRLERTAKARSKDGGRFARGGRVRLERPRAMRLKPNIATPQSMAAKMSGTIAPT